MSLHLYLATAHLKGPHVDFAGLSPLIALLGGAVVVLIVGLLGAEWARHQLVPFLSLLALGAACGLRSGNGTRRSRSSPARFASTTCRWR